MTELLGLPYSPWSEKARWALDARKVPYRFRHYSPLLGEPALRARLRRWRGKVSVPVLFVDGRAITDSAEIARWADGRGQGPTLFPSERVAHFVALSERGLAAGRARSLRAVLSDPAAVAELIPRRLRSVPGALFLGKLGVYRTWLKYGRDATGMEAVLDELRASLNGADYLLGSFSFADIAMAQVLAFVVPPAKGLKLGDANRERYGDPVLAARYPDLLKWRDALYARHR